jgi:DNA polymerase III subunit epsilon
MDLRLDWRVRTVHWKESRIAVVDVETTGFSNQEDRVIEVGIVIFEGGEVVEKYGQLVNPGRPIPEVVVKLTGIRDEDVAKEPPFEQVATEVLSRLQDAVIVGYNLSFDKGFLSMELERSGLNWPEASELDPLIFARQLHKGRGGNKLGQVAERLGISLENAHRAVDDAEATGHVLFALAEQLPPQLEELLIVQEQWTILQAQERAMWRRNRGGDVLSETPSSGGASLAQVDGLPALGPAYLYGDETDPLRALYVTLPDVGSRR